jgi:hypothetical protein
VLCCTRLRRGSTKIGSVDWAVGLLLHALTGTWTLVCESTVAMASRLAQSAANAAKEGSKTRHFFLEVALSHRSAAAAQHVECSRMAHVAVGVPLHPVHPRFHAPRGGHQRQGHARSSEGEVPAVQARHRPTGAFTPYTTAWIVYSAAGMPAIVCLHQLSCLCSLSALQNCVKQQAMF